MCVFHDDFAQAHAALNDLRGAGAAEDLYLVAWQHGSVTIERFKPLWYDDNVRVFCCRASGEMELVVWG